MCLTTPFSVVSVFIFIIADAYFISCMAVFSIILIFNYRGWFCFHLSLLPYFLFVHLFHSVHVLNHQNYKTTAFTVYLHVLHALFSYLHLHLKCSPFITTKSVHRPCFSIYCFPIYSSLKSDIISAHNWGQGTGILHNFPTIYLYVLKTTSSSNLENPS